MRNQWSFRTKSRLKVIDNSVKVSQVIGKKDSNWQPFYPSFTNTTVVLVSEDKRTYETTKATADWLGNITFLKRWLADDWTDTEVAKFKKAWMPWTLMYVTIASEDIENKQDTLTAWCNITIYWNVISAIDTTYQSCDFDINDLRDWCGCKNYWNCAIQPNDNISCLCNDAGYTTCTWTVTDCDLACYAQCCDLGCVATSNEYCDLNWLPTIWSANLILQRNWTDIDCFSANATVDKCINITVPTQACDICAMPDSVKYWASIDLSVDTCTYVITSQLKDQCWCNLGSACTIDLPLESVVVDWCYNSCTKEIELTLENCCKICFSVADLVSWLQAEITCSNKLSSDLVDDSWHTNLFVDCTEKCCISSALQPNDNVSCLCNDAWYLTTSTLPSLWSRVVKVEVATGNSTAAKTWTTIAGNYSPAAWDILLVHFKYWNSAAGVTLAVDNSAAKAIRIWWKVTTTATFTIPNQTDMYVYLMYDWQAYVAYPTDNTTYSASSFDIKNLADSCSCRDHWNCALQPNDNISCLCNDASYVTESCVACINGCCLTQWGNICICWWGGGWSWDVTWPASSTDWNIVLFDWATGKLIKDSARHVEVFVITEDMITKTTTDQSWVAPYNTSYKYTNLEIDATKWVKRVEWWVYYFVWNSLTVASTYRNVRVRIWSDWAWIPMMDNAWTIQSGYSYVKKAYNKPYIYSTKYQAWWALHWEYDVNTTYSAMSNAEATTWTCTSWRTIAACTLKCAIDACIACRAQCCDIPTNNSQLSNGCGYTTCTWTVVASDLTPYAKSCDLCTVATTGLYCDLSWQPTIPTDNCQLSNGCWYTTCTWTLTSSDIACINWCCLTSGWNICLDWLPSQTWNCGKFLTTDWSNASWWTVSGWITNDTTCTSTVVAHIRAWTEAEYNCIATKDSCTIYHIY